MKAIVPDVCKDEHITRSIPTMSLARQMRRCMRARKRARKKKTVCVCHNYVVDNVFILSLPSLHLLLVFVCKSVGVLICLFSILSIMILVLLLLKKTFHLSRQ